MKSCLAVGFGIDSGLTIASMLAAGPLARSTVRTVYIRASGVMADRVSLAQ